VNTHYHVDHVSGDQVFKDAGEIIVAPHLLAVIRKMAKTIKNHFPFVVLMTPRLQCFPIKSYLLGPEAICRTSTSVCRTCPTRMLMAH
jgi:glyoxylase-like metal-dependent hydrolase (beta-lactamase superfamily II)